MKNLIFATIKDLKLTNVPHASADSSAIHTLLSIAIGFIAGLSLLFIVIGGLRYILSQGDSQAVSKAKGTIIYALIGLVIAILAQAIVVFVVGKVK